MGRNLCHKGAERNWLWEEMIMAAYDLVRLGQLAGQPLEGHRLQPDRPARRASGSRSGGLADRPHPADSGESHFARALRRSDSEVTLGHLSNAWPPLAIPGAQSGRRTIDWPLLTTCGRGSKRS